jgi:hypothetical protein
MPRDELAADIKAIVKSDTETLVDAVSQGEIAPSELKVICREVEAGTVEIDEDVLSLVRIVTSLLTQGGECAEDTTT